jgi:hypothetical protein
MTGLSGYFEGISIHIPTGTSFEGLLRPHKTRTFAASQGEELAQQGVADGNRGMHSRLVAV